ncbi:sugar transferase [Gloeobacter kilaueensis]|uniref:Glycosyltransferase n=1 Tax=Gloeobacter kilaueensis (strain ATCC BAA-2537 / CCAP 1431/1 / ULC 316 / JS1) TaxID=1183438 RepID=U5QCR5_GLOK1|nr:sugar transferase [Gloeobacter kilaueensis]AGY56712.1 glycosyltransferase [Gloeobacter kilaueensis JS1]
MNTSQLQSGRLSFAPPRPAPLSYRFLKRAFDFCAAAFGLLLLAPLLVLVALVICLDSPGPIFFRQQRLGRGGRPFRIWKFRTMVKGAEAQLARLENCNESEGGVLFKMKADPRVTRLGAFLRRTSLDELPQLINVLAGQMSLVGPRPLQLRDCERARERYPDVFAHRLSVLPGITGPWQVRGRSEVAFEPMLHLDLDYIAQRSFWLDLVILQQTLVVVLARRGAY